MKGLILVLSWLLVGVSSCKEGPNEISGYDYQGKEKTCILKEADRAQFCTEVFTKEDAFAMECRKRGYKSTKCGCHDHICDTKFDFKFGENNL